MPRNSDETVIVIPIHGEMVEMTLPEAKRVFDRLKKLFDAEDSTPEGQLFGPRSRRPVEWG